MQLTRANIRTWARQEGWVPSEPHMLSTMVHDETWCCDTCGGRFTDESDMACDEDGIPYGDVCEACDEDGDASEHSTYHVRGGSVVG